MQYGWVCPKCGRVNAPWMPECPCCRDKRNEKRISDMSNWESTSPDDEEIYDIKCVKCGNVMKYDFETRTYYCDCDNESGD